MATDNEFQSKLDLTLDNLLNLAKQTNQLTEQVNSEIQKDREHTLLSLEQEWDDEETPVVFDDCGMRGTMPHKESIELMEYWFKNNATQK